MGMDMLGKSTWYLYLYAYSVSKRLNEYSFNTIFEPLSLINTLAVSSKYTIL